jgi:hypothetical protein
LESLDAALKEKEIWQSRLQATKSKYEVLRVHQDTQQASLKLISLRSEIAAKQAKVKETNLLLLQLRETIDKVTKGLNTQVPEVDKVKVVPVADEPAELREAYLKEAADVLSLNSFYPDFAVGELFKISESTNVFRMGEAAVGRSMMDAPSTITVSMRTNLSFANEDHKNSVVGSIEMLCRFINFASHLCDVDLPFELLWMQKYFVLMDQVRLVQRPLDVLNLFSFESSMILLYLNFRVLLLSRQISPTTQCLFDVKAMLRQLERSGVDPLPESFELGVGWDESQTPNEEEEFSDDSWEVL